RDSSPPRGGSRSFRGWQSCSWPSASACSPTASPNVSVHASRPALPLLEIRNLSVVFGTAPERVEAVDAVSFAVQPGEIMGLVGESGSGKTVTCRAMLRLLPSGQPHLVTGAALFEDTDLLTVPEEEIEHLHGRRIGMIFQNPSTHLDPLMTIGRQ